MMRSLFVIIARGKEVSKMAKITREEIDAVVNGRAEYERAERIQRVKKLVYDMLAFAAAMVMAIAVVIAILCNAGCVYKGAKVTEGTSLVVGLDVPGTDGVAELNVLSWLSGFRLGVAENARLELEYTAAETNSYFGVVQTRIAKTVKAKVEPCEVLASDDAGESAADGADCAGGKIADDPANTNRLDEVE